MQFKAVLFKCQEVGSYSFIHNFHVVWGGKKSICLLLFLLLPSVIRWRLYSLVKTVSFDFSNYTNNIKQIDVFQERNGAGGEKKKKTSQNLCISSRAMSDKAGFKDSPYPHHSRGNYLIPAVYWFHFCDVFFSSSSPNLQSTLVVCLFVFPDVPWTLLDFKANAVNVEYFQLEGDLLHPYHITQGLGCSKLGLSDTWLWGMSVKMPMKQERDS